MATGIKPHNIFEALPADLDAEVFENLVQSERVRIERIISRGHGSPVSGWYDQAQDEWVLVLRGEAVIAYASGEKVNLAAGDHINIPAHTRHRVDWTTPETETVWLAVHY